MRKLIATIVLSVLCIGLANAQKGVMGVGGNVLYGSEINSVGIGAKFQYGITNEVRAEASFSYFFKHKGFHMWDLSANAHYLFNVTPRFRAYPLAGLTVVNRSEYTKVIKETPESPETTETREAVTRFGLNLGGGCEFDVTNNVSLNAEVKYTVVSTIDQAVVGIGAVYKF